MLPDAPIVAWIKSALAPGLDTPTEEYLFARGAKQETLTSMGISLWTPPATACPDPAFAKDYGAYGGSLRGWLIIPLTGPDGRFLGFTGRAPAQKAFVQYRVPVAHAHACLFGLDQALPKIWAGAPVWVTEGAFDMFALEWAYAGPVVVAGTAKISNNQIEFFRRFASEVVVVFDMDGAGRKGSTDAIRDLTRVGVRCRELTYQGGKDPGVLWDRGGAERLRAEFGRYT